MEQALVFSHITRSDRSLSLIGSFICVTQGWWVTSQVFTCSFLLMLSHVLTPAVKNCRICQNLRCFACYHSYKRRSIRQRPTLSRLAWVEAFHSRYCRSRRSHTRWHKLEADFITNVTNVVCQCHTVMPRREGRGGQRHFRWGVAGIEASRRPHCMFYLIYAFFKVGVDAQTFAEMYSEYLYWSCIWRPLMHKLTLYLPCSE